MMTTTADPPPCLDHQATTSTQLPPYRGNSDARGPTIKYMTLSLHINTRHTPTIDDASNNITTSATKAEGENLSLSLTLLLLLALLLLTSLMYSWCKYTQLFGENQLALKQPISIRSQRHNNNQTVESGGCFDLPRFDLDPTCHRNWAIMCGQIEGRGSICSISPLYNKTV